MSGFSFGAGNLESQRASHYSTGMLDGSGSRFPVTMRLKKRTDFLRVFRKGATWSGACFALHVLPRAEGPRLGIVISRKYGTAVERNRAKRRIREAFRANTERLPNADILVRPSPACREATVDEIAELLIEGASRAIGR